MKKNVNFITFLHKVAEEIRDYDKAMKWIDEEVQKHSELKEVLLHLHYKGVVLSSETVDLVTNKFNNRK